MGDRIKLNRIITICIYATVIIVPFVYLPFIFVYDFFYWPKYMALVFISTFLLIQVLLNLDRMHTLFKFDWINTLLLTYFVLITISLFFSLDPITSIQGRINRYDGYTTQVIYMLLFLFARNISVIDKRFIKLVAISTTILSIYGIIQYLGFEPFMRDLTRLYWKAAFSTFGNQNFFGSFLVLQLPFSLYIISVYRMKWGYLSYSISLLALMMTSTRSAWIGFAISFVFMFILLLRKNNHYKWIVLVTLFILFGFNFMTDSHMISRFLSIFKDANVLLTTSYQSNPEVIDRLGSVRMFIWVRTLELIKMRPWFGFGIENLDIAFGQYYYEDTIKLLGRYALSDKAHNDYLHIAVSSGVPSLIAYCGFLLRSAYESFKTLDQEINVLLFASILGYLACLFFNISVVSVAYILWIYLGLLTRYKTTEVQ